MSQTKMLLHGLIEENEFVSANIKAEKKDAVSLIHLEIILKPLDKEEPEDEYQTL
mgnify:CR=1 FL=1|jgi:hypothetical protein